MPADKVFVIIGETGGFAPALAASFEAAGSRAMLASIKFVENRDDVAALMTRLRAEDRAIAGIIVCLTDAKETELNLPDLNGESWRRLWDHSTLALLRLAQAAAVDLRRARGWVVGVSTGGSRVSPADDGMFGAAVAYAGATGFLKSFAAEWPEVCCKAIEISRDAAASAQAVLNEISARDERIEVSYRGDERLTWQAEVDTSAAEAGAASALLVVGAVVLVTGGARGITAEVIREVAAGRRLVLHLAGQSRPPQDEAEDTVGIDDPHVLKGVLLGRQRYSGRAPTPLEIETAFARIIKDREMRATIADLRRMGCTVHYHQLDVRDIDELGKLIDEIYRTEGRIDGVIHGAGIIEDCLVEAKTVELFRRVLGTKVDAGFALAHRLRPEHLKFLIFFTSVAGLFGNRGQTDYSAANEILGALARHLARCWPHVLIRAVNWGPWRKGMASQEVQRQLAARDVQIIEPKAGRRALASELERGVPAGVEVILGDGPWRTSCTISQAPLERLPLVATCSRTSGGPDGSFELTRTVDPVYDLYLEDHRLDGRRVFPAAMHVELMAEAAISACPERAVIGIHDFQLLKGVVLAEQGPIALRVITSVSPRDDRALWTAEVIIHDVRSKRACSRATVLLARSDDYVHSSPTLSRIEIGALTPFKLTVEQAYDRMLFHGPRLRSISDIHGVGANGIAATLRPSRPGDLLASASTLPWLFDPVVIDGAFQLAILWIRSQADMTPLPSRFDRLLRLGRIEGSTIRCELQARQSFGGSLLETNIRFIGDSGRLVACLDGMEFNCSRALNRLAGGGSEQLPLGAAK